MANLGAFDAAPDGVEDDEIGIIRSAETNPVRNVNWLGMAFCGDLQVTQPKETGTENHSPDFRDHQFARGRFLKAGGHDVSGFKLDSFLGQMVKTVEIKSAVDGVKAEDAGGLVAAVGDADREQAEGNVEIGNRPQGTAEEAARRIVESGDSLVAGYVRLERADTRHFKSVPIPAPPTFAGWSTRVGYSCVAMTALAEMYP
jgi:hypothetical protein